MDCKTAQRMLDFARPQHVELDPLDLRALETHVAGCPDCALLSKRERQLDEQLGKAMRDIDVPDRLRARLLDRLAEDRAVGSARRRKAVVGGFLAAAAAVLLAVGGWIWYYQATLKPLDVDAIVQRAIEDQVSPPDRTKLEDAYRKQGVQIIAPAAFNYSFLAHYGMADLQDKQVPCLVFIRNDGPANIHEEAKVYVVSEREFNLKDVQANYQSAGGYHYKVEVQREPGARFAYVIVHTGETLDWLRRGE